MQNKTRAIRPTANSLRTSHSPLPSARQSGMPTGQENSTSLMSSPMTLRSSSSRAFSHSRTGSRPTAERKKQQVTASPFLSPHSRTKNDTNGQQKKPAEQVQVPGRPAPDRPGRAARTAGRGRHARQECFFRIPSTAWKHDLEGARMDHTKDIMD